MTTRDTGEWIWSKPWILAWAAFSFLVPPLVFVLPFYAWALLAAGIFGPMESFALWYGRRFSSPRLNPFPPLTYAAIYGVPPLWFVYSYTGWVIGTAGTFWLTPDPAAWKVGLAGGIAFWLAEHWRTTALSPPRPL